MSACRKLYCFVIAASLVLTPACSPNDKGTEAKADRKRCQEPILRNIQS